LPPEFFAKCGRHGVRVDTHHLIAGEMPQNSAWPIEKYRRLPTMAHGGFAPSFHKKRGVIENQLKLVRRDLTWTICAELGVRG
jgi:hypothetical protein